MSLYNTARKFIFKHLPEVTEQKVVTSETAVIRSLMYSSLEWPQYNPDDLIGRKGYQIYARMMIDEQVKAVTRFRRDSTTGRDWFFEIEEDMPEEEKQRRIDMFSKIVTRVKGSWKSRLDVIMRSMHQGFSITSKVFELFDHEGKTQWGLHSMMGKPYESFYFYLDDFGRLIKLVQKIADVEKKLDINNFIHHVHNADVDEFYGRSELREAYRAYFSKDIAHRLWNMFLERYATGFVVGKPTGNKSFVKGTTEWNDFIDALNSIRATTAMIPPKDVDIEIHQFKDTDAYEKAIQQHDKSIAKALLMPNMLGLSEVGPGGNRALGETQLQAFLWILNSEAKHLEETVNEQVFQSLGELNFDDGIYPKMRFKNRSDSETQKLVSTWNDLVSGGAVEHTEEDEAHTRNLLGYPQKLDPKDKDDESKSGVNPDTALNGPQVSSLLEIIDKVAQEVIPRDTGVQLIITSFPVSLVQAEDLMGKVGKGFKPKQPEPVVNPAANALPGEVDKGKPLAALPPPNDKSMEETIVGGTLLQIAYSKALKRVDFTTISRVSTVAGEVALVDMTGAMAEGIKAVEKELNTVGLTEINEVKRISLPSSTKRELKKASGRLLRESWRLGLKQAIKEIERAKKANFTSRRLFTSLEDQAAAYLRNNAFEMAGVLSDDANKIIQHEIVQGVKFSKSVDMVVDAIYTAFATKGLIDKETVEQALGVALDLKNPTARLETAIRTSSFDAINEARFSFFQSDELEGFVEAMEYSAILDSRTTAICSELDGKVYPKNAEEWNGYRPPNHFNCRSLLIPVTQDDVWVSSDSPSLNPQEGFD